MSTSGRLSVLLESKQEIQGKLATSSCELICLVCESADDVKEYRARQEGRLFSWRIQLRFRCLLALCTPEVGRLSAR